MLNVYTIKIKFSFYITVITKCQAAGPLVIHQNIAQNFPPPLFTVKIQQRQQIIVLGSQDLLLPCLQEMQEKSYLLIFNKGPFNLHFFSLPLSLGGCTKITKKVQPPTRAFFYLLRRASAKTFFALRAKKRPFLGHYNFKNNRQ